MGLKVAVCHEMDCRGRIRRYYGARNQKGKGMDHSNYVIDEMISAKSIAARVEALAKEISEYFEGTDKLIVVGLLRGSFVFIADLFTSARKWGEE